MLERASTCLETGRHILRTPKQPLCRRRTLHSTFWHHGASDLILPVWWASASVFEPVDGDANGGYKALSKVSAGRAGRNGLFLDFLYPDKTMAILQKMSSLGLDTTESRRRNKLSRNSIRQFSTSQREESYADIEEEAKENALRESQLREIQLREDMEERLRGSTAIDALNTLLEEKTPGNQELAWRLYSAIPTSSRTSAIKVTLLEYLTSRTVSVEASRVLQIFDTLAVDDRRASSYRAATYAYVTLRMVGQALQLQDEAADRYSGLHCGIDALLERTIEDDQWKLTLRAFKTLIRSAFSNHLLKSHFDYYREDLTPAWKVVGQLPDLSDHLMSLLEYADQFQHEIDSDKETRKALRILINGFVPKVIDQVLTPVNPDENQILAQGLALFHELRRLDLPRARSYEYTLHRLLKLPRYREYTGQRKIFQEVYNLYRAESLQRPGYMRPAKSIIGRLILQHGDKGSIEVVGGLVDDLQHFYKEEWCSHAPTMVYLVQFYAEHGVIDRVHEYFNVLRVHHPARVELKIISSLLYVYARQVDVRGTQAQFRRISGEFGLVPDTACWNILLLAHTRADDLDGALACFNNILESGVVPDTFTFGPLLDLCAARGDIEAFEALYSKAEQLKIPVRTDVRARAGYVQTLLQSEDVEGAEAVAQAMLKNHQTKTLHGSLTHTWNLLITHYALMKDVGNSRRLYRQMIDNHIPLDSWTYAALMRALIEVHQTNAAYKILRVTMPNNNMQVHPFHYALVMTGFLREGQYEHAERAYNRMEKRNVRQTNNSRQASLLTIGMTELRKLKKENVKDPRTRLIAVEEALRSMLFEGHQTELAHREPKHSRFIDSRQESVPQGYFGLLILLYSTRGAYEICKELFEAASTARTDDANYQPPIMLLTAIMEAHIKAKEYGEVKKCWDLALAQSSKLVKTVQQVIDPQPPQPEFDSLLDPALKDSNASARIATNRRQVLHRPARIYIRSLLNREDPMYLQEAQRTISYLLTNGFIIDNQTWNEFIQMLARRGRIVDAYSACEYYLMPAFPGWRNMEAYYIRKNVPAYIWMDIRNSDIGRKTIMPRYKTLVILAAAYAQLKRDEANGRGYNPDQGGWPREVLEKISPLTVRAIETMPRTGDKLQVQFLEGA